MRRSAILALFALACGGAPQPGTALVGWHPIARDRFNQLALRLNVPLVWASDDDEDGQPDPSEVRTLLFYPTAETWADDAGFTRAFDAALAHILAEDSAPPPTDRIQPKAA